MHEHDVFAVVVVAAAGVATGLGHRVTAEAAAELAAGGVDEGDGVAGTEVAAHARHADGEQALVAPRDRLGRAAVEHECAAGA